MSKREAKQLAYSLAASVMHSFFESAETLLSYSNEDRLKIEEAWFNIAEMLDSRSGGKLVMRDGE